MELRIRYGLGITLALAATGLSVACAVDDSVAPPSATRTGSGGKTSSSGPIVTSVGSAGFSTNGAGGVPDGVGTTGPGGSAGEGGTATNDAGDDATGGAGGMAGNGGRAGGGGDQEAGSRDAALESGRLDAQRMESGAESGAVDARILEASHDVVDASCTLETDAVFCARLQKNCGAFIAIDNCGVSRTTSCGICVPDAADCGRGGTINVCSGGGPINRAQGGTVTSSNMADVAGEDMSKAFDADINTKWIALLNPTPWITYQFSGGQTFAITSYTVTAGNDAPDRDPKDWRFEGSNDGVNWTTLDTRTNETFASRFQTNRYSFANTTAYPVYQFKVTANAGSSDFQLAEIQMFGNPGPVPEAAPPDSSTDDVSSDAAARDDAKEDASAD